MADVKNFGLIGVGSSLQFGKGSSKLVNNAGVFNFKQADGSTDTALTAAGITSSAGNVTLTTGNLVLSSESGKLSIGGTDMIVKNATTGGVQIAGTSSVALPAGTSATRGTGVAGAFRANTDVASATLEYFDGSVWKTLATGGNTASLQTEIDAIETSLGGIVDASGVYVPAALTNTTIFGSGTNTSLTAALNNLATYVDGKNTLDEIFPATGVANVIYAGAGNTWLQAAPGSTSGVQAYDLGLTNLAAKTSTGIMIQTGNDTYATATITGPAAGITVTNGDGVAGNPTLALANDLAALEGLTGTGFAVRTAADTWAQRSLTQPAAGFTITNADGVAGNPTFALANDLAAIEGLTTIGYMVRTGDGTATTRSLAVVSGDLVITGDAAGATTDTTFGLAAVTQAATGDFVKVTLDSKGRVTGNTAVTTADITALVDSTYVNVNGDTMTGSLTMGTGTHITLTDSPVNPTDAANKAYVDATAAGLSWKQAVKAASTGDLTLSGAQTVDGVSLIAGDRVLVKNQATAADNGIYIVAAGAWTRSTDADSAAELDSATVFVQQGTVNADSGWTQTATIVTVGTTAQTWAQFSGSATYVWGDGLVATGNTISVNMGAGITMLPSDEVGIDVASNKAIQLTGTGIATGDQLTLVLDTGSGLEQSSAGLKISANGVTNAMILNDTMLVNGDTGTGSLALGGTLEVKGTSTQGIVTSVNGTGTFTVTASDASSSQKGVATFNTADFAVTGGDVTIKAGGVDNAQLAFSTISLAANTGSGSVALGGTLTVSSADSAITATASAGAVSLQLNTVDVAHGGTGATTFAANEVLFGNGTSPVQTSNDFKFTPGATVDTLAIGGGATGTTGLTLSTNTAGNDVTLTAVGTNGDLVLMPNGTGSVIVGPVGAGLIQSDTGTALTVRGNTTLTLTSGTGSTTMALAAGTTAKVSVSGPTATDYATSLAANDLTNKQYVDDAIQAGAASGSIKAVKLAGVTAGTTSIGAAMPANATVLSVKVMVTTADATGTVSVGKSGGVANYMTTAENDPAATGLYLSETYVTEASSTQVIATVTGTGVYTIFVEYQVA